MSSGYVVMQPLSARAVLAEACRGDLRKAEGGSPQRHVDTCNGAQHTDDAQTKSNPEPKPKAKTQGPDPKPLNTQRFTLTATAG